LFDIKFLKTVFHYEKFRFGQKESLITISKQLDCITVLPTGGGKSLIYQYFSLLNPDKIVIVISPLIALMKDQVDIINAKGIRAETIHSSLDDLEQLKYISLAVQNKISLLFISPEKAVSTYFQKYLKEMKISLVVIDEAHCISQWGHDFRPEYTKLHILRELNPNLNFPILALTATATDSVIRDIKNSLNLKNPNIIKGSFKRENLIFQIQYLETESEKEVKLINILNNFQEPGRIIIYCSTRKKTEELEDLLKNNGIKATYYHAGRTDKQRNTVQNGFLSGKVKILIATNAFGMGIDLPDIRIVIHYQTPSSIESYYQEAGRAGRDGNVSKCILFYKPSDFNISRFLIKGRDLEDKKKILEQMKNFILSEKCRQEYICDYFGEKTTRCGVCDNCNSTNNSIQIFKEKEFIKIEKKKSNETYSFLKEELNIIDQYFQNYPAVFGKKIAIGILRGSKSTTLLRKKLHTSNFFGKLKHIKEEALQKQLEIYIEEGRLKLTKGKYPKCYLTNYPPIKKTIKKEKSVSNLSNKLLYELKYFRDKEAKKLNWKKYMVLHNVVISRIAKTKPLDINALRAIKGLGEAKIKKFGDSILTIVKQNA
jgi:ATP-dependent DNA helicase RecQ